MDKQYSVEFFTSLVESIQKCCREFLEFDQAIELSGYLNLEIDNYKKERYVLSEMMSQAGDVISESYCTKAFKTVHRNRSPVPNTPAVDTVLRDNTNQWDRKQVRNRESPAPPDVTSRVAGDRRYSGLSQRHHYLSAFRPGRKRNLIQNRRTASFTQSSSHTQNPSYTQNSSFAQSPSYTQSSSFTPSASSQSKDTEQYGIEARTSMAMTFNPTEEMTITFSDNSLESSDVKAVLSHQDGTPHSTEKATGDLEGLYDAAASVSNMQQPAFPSVSSNSSNIYPSVSETGAVSVPTSSATDTTGSSYTKLVKVKQEDDDDDVMVVEGPSAGPSTGDTDMSHSNMQGSHRTSLLEGEADHSQQTGAGEDGKKPRMRTGLTEKDVLRSSDQPGSSDSDFYIVSTSAGHAHPLTNTSATFSSSHFSPKRYVDPMSDRNTSLSQVNYALKGNVLHGSTSSSKVYRCDICGYEASRNYNLTRHMRTHTGNRPKCPLCDKSYIDNYQLKYHLRSHGIDGMFLSELQARDSEMDKSLSGYHEETGLS